LRNFIVFLLFGAFVSSAWSQFDKGGAQTNEQHHPHSVWFDVPFNHEDVALGIVYRYSVHADQFLGIFASFQGRPFGKKILLQDGPNFYFQLKEYRYVTTFGLDKKFWINNKLDIFIGGGVGIAAVDYRGTGEGTFMGHQIEKKEGFVPVAKAGFSFKLNRYLFLRAGYMYFDAKTIGGHRVTAGIGGQL